MNHLALNKEISTDEVREVLLEVLDIQSEDLFVCASVENLKYVPVDGMANIVIRSIGGDFPLNIEIYSDSNLTDEDFARAFCIKHRIKAIISDETTNPYQWVVLGVSASNDMVVLVDARELDDNDSFVVLKITPKL